MSFILDALKKLEHKRHRSSVPNLLTIHDFTSEKQKRRLPWTYLLLAILLINAGILMVLLNSRQSEKPDNVRRLTGVPRHESVKRISDSPLPDTNIPKITAQGAGAVNKESSPEQDTAVVPALKQVSTVPQIQKVQQKEDGYEQMPLANSNGTPEERIPERNELPISIQQELPDITIAGHIYSNDPSSRIVNINGQVKREGETVIAGLTLEKITETGVILNYKGYRFSIKGF